ncbi:MAG: hypothetical protein KIS96_10910 [Bauldia sp.]|nr:hypothetical protein [Bauldia sp.]
MIGATAQAFRAFAATTMNRPMRQQGAALRKSPVTQFGVVLGSVLALAVASPANAWERYRCSPDADSGRVADETDWPAFVGDRIINGGNGYAVLLTREDGFQNILPCNGMPRNVPGLQCGGRFVSFELDTLTLRYNFSVTDAEDPQFGPAFQENGSCHLLKHKRVRPDGFLWN